MVKAVKLPGYPDECDLKPGECHKVTEDFFGFACPGCGRWGGIRAAEVKPEESPSWKIEEGTLDDPNNLTLSPSIHCVGCCGWHGHLKKGVFVPC